MAIAPVSGLKPAAAYARTKRSAAAPAAAAVRGPAVVHDLPVDLPERLQAAFAALHAQVEELQRELLSARQRICELERQTETDDLVPVGNRRGFDRDLKRALAEVDRSHMSAAVMFIDVDRMKAINDSYGHAAGDRALVHLGELLKENLRTSDSIARLGGDEFAVLLTHVVAPEARAKARQIARIVAERPVEHDGADFFISVSTGVQMLEPGQRAADLLSAADREMYEHKARSRSR